MTSCTSCYFPVGIRFVNRANSNPDWDIGQLDMSATQKILPTVNTTCMQIFLKEIAVRYPEESIVMVLDCAGWHRSVALKAPSNMVLIHLPPYSPELNPVEHLWDD